jgi:aryl-alcohol dehydrogenase-like predicted oxidoreductase
MLNRPLGASGLSVSFLALGTMAWGSSWHGRKPVDEKTAARLLDMALEAGVNLIDTADVYGHGASEEMLGRLIKGRRSRLLLASKVLGSLGPGTGGLSSRWIARALEGSLRRLGVDYLDLYMPHGWDPGVPAEETFEALELLRKDGKFRVLGVSNYDAAMLKRASSLAGVHFNQVQYSAGVRFAEQERVEGVSVMAWSPLGGGWLTGGRPEFPAFPKAAGLAPLLAKVGELEGMTQAQAALGFVLARPWVSSAVIGPRTPEQLHELLQAKPLSAKGVDFIERAGEACSAR